MSMCSTSVTPLLPLSQNFVKPHAASVPKGLLPLTVPDIDCIGFRLICSSKLPEHMPETDLLIEMFHEAVTHYSDFRRIEDHLNGWYN